MLVYEGIKKDFMKSIDEETIATEIEQKLIKILNKKTARNEFRAWENSLEYMYKVLNDNNISDDVGIAIEYNIITVLNTVHLLNL